jgi:UDP-hydrolysing UDP-N-acetyl-D-glucosamine 2-epimerase
MLRLGVLTTGRQDWGILRSVCVLARDADDIDLRLFAGGMALSRTYGMNVETMVADGLPPAERLDWLAGGEAETHHQAASALAMMGDALKRCAVDALLLVGDRFETISAGIAATLQRVPIVHLHGGEETEGAFDNALRHALTKLSHLHLVSHPDYARRIVAMGEDPSTVHVVGAPGLDNLHRDDLPTRAELEARLGLPLEPPVVVVTLHPATLGDDPAKEAAAVCGAMDAVDATYVITLPNNDPGATTTRTALERAVARPRRVAVEALGDRYYWSLLRTADAMLGNSSSALVEAPAVRLPAVNVGKRQKGRLREANVIDADADARSVTEGLRRALDPTFRTTLRASLSALADGRAGERVVGVLRGWTPPKTPSKRWFQAD